MEIKLQIQDFIDRQNIITALANSGIGVHVEKKTHLARDTYYVIFNYYSDDEIVKR